MSELLERCIGPEIIMGDAFTFKCPVCARLFKYGHQYEPICTGPSENRDDHPPETMRLVKVDRKEIGPKFAERQAMRPLILPDGFKAS